MYLVLVVGDPQALDQQEGTWLYVTSCASLCLYWDKISSPNEYVAWIKEAE